MSWFKSRNDSDFHRKVEEAFDNAGVDEDTFEDYYPGQKEQIDADVEQAVDEYMEAEASKPALFRWLGL